MRDHSLSIQQFELSEIESIEFLGDLPTIDIEVEDVHMFYANDIYTHNSGYDQDIVEAQHVADSFKKIMIGDFVMSVSRKAEDKVHSIARFHIIKNRFGPDGMTFPAQFDTDCGRLQIFDPGSSEGMNLQNKMGDNNDNSVKNMIRDKWNRNKSKQNDD
jgi:hypothetical protein